MAHSSHRVFPSTAEPFSEIRIPLHTNHKTSGSADLHLEPCSAGWQVRSDDDPLPCFTGPSRHQAFVWACDLARRLRVCVYVHRTDGRVVAEIDLATSPQAPPQAC